MSDKAGKKKEPKAAPAGDKDAAPVAAPKGRAGKKSEPAAADSKPIDDAKGESREQRAPARQGAGSREAPRIPKPDVAERDKELEAIIAEINKLKAERDEVNKKINAIIETSKGGNDERSKVRQEAAKIRDELKVARDAKDAVMNQQKAAFATLEAKLAEERKAKDAVGKFSTVETIDLEVTRIEKAMMTGRFSAKEEKDMIREMDKLKMSKKNIGAVKAKSDEVQKARDAKKEIEAVLSEKKAVVDEVSKRYQNIRDALTALDQKDKDGIGAALPKLKETKDALNAKIEALLGKKAAVYEDFKKQMNDFHALLEERRKAEKERREAEDERRRAEREEREKAEQERRKAIEEEEAKKKPWEAEIALCDVLIAYLERLQKGTSAGSAAGTPSSSSTAAQAPKRAGTDFGNLKPLVRTSEDDYIALGKKTAKPAKEATKEKTTQKDKAGTLTHSLDILSSFALLGLIPPATEADIETSIQQLKDKRAYFDVLPRPAKAAAAPNSTASEAQNGEPNPVGAASVAEDHPAESNKRSGGRKKDSALSVQDSSSFPTLPGSKLPAEANEGKQKWGPKPVEASAMDDVLEEDME